MTISQQSEALNDMKRLQGICLDAGGMVDSGPQYVARFIYRVMTSLRVVPEQD